MGALVKAGRVSRTVIKPGPGFRAELPGLDLPTLIQMTCARRERLVVRVSSYGEEGFLYSSEGRLVHATTGDLVGEEAVLRILAWPAGDFSLCERPFPLHPTIESSTEGLLLRAAQRDDEAAALELETDLGLRQEVGLAELLEGEDEDLPTLALEPAAQQHPFRPYAPLPELNLQARREEAPQPHASARVADAPLPHASPSSPLTTWPLTSALAPQYASAGEPPQARSRSGAPAGAEAPALASLLQARPRDDEGLPTVPMLTPHGARPEEPRHAVLPHAAAPGSAGSAYAAPRPPPPPRSRTLPVTPALRPMEAVAHDRSTAPGRPAPSSAPAPRASEPSPRPRQSVPGPAAVAGPARAQAPVEIAGAKRPSLPDALPPVSLDGIVNPPRRLSEPPPRRTSEVPARPAPERAPAAVSLPKPIVTGAQDAARRRLPPPPPAELRRPSTPPSEDQSVLASVRMNAQGAVVGSSGGDDQLAQLTAYVARVAALIQDDFALAPFDALHAELAGKRVLIYRSQGELIGMVMKPGSAAQELRQKLGV